MLASILQLHLDFFRAMNHKRMVQLQQHKCAVEQKHQDLVFLMQQYQAVMGKVPLLGTTVTAQAAWAAHPWPCAPYSHPITGKAPCLPNSPACANSW